MAFQLSMNLYKLTLGTALAYRISTGTAATVFTIPWAPLTAVAALTILASVLAATQPANNAATIPPAAALRTAT